MNNKSLLPILLVMLVFAYYIFVYQPQSVRRNVQVAYDTCIYNAENNYLNNQRAMCWKYNYDGIDCDLSYFEVYKLPEKIPATTFKEDKSDCEQKYPVADRTYPSVSPSYKSPLDKFIGNLSEGEAFSKINQYGEVIKSSGRNIASKLKEDFNLPDARAISYHITRPTEADSNWYFIFYQITDNGDRNLVTYKVNAFSGEVSSQ